MLRYFYLLCLLVYIETTFCYEFIPERDSNRPNFRRNQSHRRKEQLRGKRQDPEAEDPVAHIDVASFMKRPDPEYDSVEDGLYENEKRSVANDYNEYDSVADPQFLQQNSPSQNSPNLENSFGLYNDKRSLDNTVPNINYPETAEASQLHKAEKKCSKKLMKFPFFSHKKTVTPKPKKNKKRRLFGFRKSKTTEVTTTLPKVIDPNSILKGSHVRLKINKRALPERFCPLCKRKIFPKSKKKIDSGQKPVLRKILHNSRQYYQEAGDLSKVKQKKETVKYNDQDDGETDDGSCLRRDNDRRYVNIERRKRSEEVDKERQLKELEEVQRKVDSVEITSPDVQRNRVVNS